MKRVVLSGSILLAIGIFVFLTTGASNPRSTTPTYRIELDNAFGLVNGADFKVSGVRAGTITGINLDQKTLRAIVTVQVSQPGFAQFHTSATCDTQPQSLIGEYFVNCEPGTSGPLLKNGATIPVTHTRSTIPADLLLDIMRMPERQRLPLIIDSLGAGVAGRSGDLQAALDRAIPALTETDNLLNLLANDSHTIQSLTASSNQVVTALARNSVQVQRFITYARNAAADTAAQKTNFQASLHDLPGFLAQLRPAMARLGQATDANLPVLRNLNASAQLLDRLFVDLPGFSHASLPALRALGQASVTGRAALQAARPTIAQLNRFTVHTPELAKNLSIVLPHLDNRKYATEKNSRSPGGQGYTGLEALLQFVFNEAGATNYYGPFGHLLAVDGFTSSMCSPYATPQTVADAIRQYGAAYRQCYAFLGPNQPGVNEIDPSNPSGCVGDPGGSVPGEPGPAPSGKMCPPASTPLAASDRSGAKRAGRRRGTHPASAGTAGAGSNSSGGQSNNPVSGGVNKISSTVGQVLSLLGGSGGSTGATAGSLTHGVSGAAGAASGSSGSNSSSQTQRLLNYLLAP